MEKRSRPKQVKFRVTVEEKEKILHNVNKLGFQSFNKYARKMLLDGYVINLKAADDEMLDELMFEVSRIGNNINQIAKAINSTHRVYGSDLKEIRNGQETLIQLVRQLVQNTNAIKNI